MLTRVRNQQLQQFLFICDACLPWVIRLGSPDDFSGFERISIARLQVLLNKPHPYCSRNDQQRDHEGERDPLGLLPTGHQLLAFDVQPHPLQRKLLPFEIVARVSGGGRFQLVCHISLVMHRPQNPLYAKAP